jgi:hypothetical protein
VPKTERNSINSNEIHFGRKRRKIMLHLQGIFFAITAAKGSSFTPSYQHIGKRKFFYDMEEKYVNPQPELIFQTQSSLSITILSKPQNSTQICSVQLVQHPYQMNTNQCS